MNKQKMKILCSKCNLKIVTINSVLSLTVQNVRMHDLFYIVV